jgi:hypothetical protein
VARKAHEVIHGPIALPPGARLINKPQIHGRFHKADTMRFIEHINRLPIYFINAHSCICTEGHDCFGEIVSPTFTLTKDTYMINMGQPGDSVTDAVDRIVVDHVEDFRRFLYLHGPDDFAPSELVGKTHFSFFAGFQRATGPRTLYPNIAYTFNHTDADGKTVPRIENPYGVYDLSRHLHHSNNNSLISQDAARTNWTLEDIIQDVYRVSGRREGIFISGGCLTPCRHPQTPESYAAEKQTMRTAGVLMHAAEAAYKGSRPVVTAGELVALAMSRPPEPVSQDPVSTHYLRANNNELYVEGLPLSMPKLFKKEGGGTRRRRS